MKKRISERSWFFIGLFGLFPALMALVISVSVVFVFVLLLLLLDTAALYRPHEVMHPALRFGIVMLSAGLGVGMTMFAFMKRGIRPAEYPYAFGMTAGTGAGALFWDLNLGTASGNLLLWSVAVASLVWGFILYRKRRYRPDHVLTPPGTMSSW